MFIFLKLIYEGVLINPLPEQEGKKLQRTNSGIYFLAHCCNFCKPLKKNSQNKVFFIFKEVFLPALCNEMHVAAISRNLVKAFHCLNNESQKVI